MAIGCDDSIGAKFMRLEAAGFKNMLNSYFVSNEIIA